MADIKAYAIHQIKAAGANVPASTKDKPSIFSIDKKSFDRLTGLGAVREPTKEELALFKAQQEAAGNGEVEADVAVDETQTGAKAPASGAAGDPKSEPKGATKKSDKDDLGV